jgi:hypothetical protein
MALAIGHPALQAAATTSLPSQVAPKSSGIVGTLENGLTFSILPSPHSNSGAWIKLTCSISQDEAQRPVSLLTQQALFYGTEQYSRQELVDKLTHFEMDIEADSYVTSHESDISLQFCLSHSEPEKVGELLDMMNQITFFPTLTLENIELARKHLLSTKEKSSHEDLLSLECVTASEAQKFHSKWYRPEHMHLTLIGFDHPQEILPLLSQAFGSDVKDHAELMFQESEQLPPDEELSGSLIDRVEWMQDHHCLVVDGKIWMKEPNWINKSSNGKTLGALLTILGIGGMIVAFPFFAPAAIIAGTLTTASGVYFLTSDYLKDPYYVESLRQIDLQKGCAFAYKNSRAGITLTPYERRALFLQEMVDHPHTLPKLPILLLADLYHLNDPVIAEIFTVDEFNVLTKLKRDFVQQRNQYKWLKESLEKELAALIAPYALARDAALLHAQEIYNQNYYVVAKYALQVNRDESIRDIEQAFEDKKISLKERNSLIEQAHVYYETAISTPEFAAGLAAAEITLVQMETEIQATYAYQVELCKQSIQYNQRMEYYNQGLSYLINFYDLELNRLLSTFPVYFTIFPDYLDLRSL